MDRLDRKTDRYCYMNINIEVDIQRPSHIKRHTDIKIEAEIKRQIKRDTDKEKG